MVGELRPLSATQYHQLLAILDHDRSQIALALSGISELTARAARIEDLLKATALVADQSGFLNDDLLPASLSGDGISGPPSLYGDGVSLEFAVSNEGSIRKLTITRRFWIMLVKWCGSWIWHHRTWVGFALGTLLSVARELPRVFHWIASLKSDGSVWPF